MTIYAKIEGVEYIVDFSHDGAVAFMNTENKHKFIFYNKKMTVKSAIEKIKELVKNQ